MIGQSLPFSDPRPSSIIAGNEKWIGPTWANVSDDLILSLTPAKTADRTGKRVSFDLRLCPLALENLPAIRSGPLVIDDAAGLPWRNQNFRYYGTRFGLEAGLPRHLLNRDLRASGLTEASMAGASSDDRAKLAAHSKRMTQTVYDRDALVSSSRVAEARARFREKKD